MFVDSINVFDCRLPSVLLYLHTQDMDIDNDSQLKFRFLAPLDMSAWTFKGGIHVNATKYQNQMFYAEK